MWQTYVAIGDSITEGYGDSVSDLDARSWTDWVADELAALNPSWTYLNLGRQGSVTTDVLKFQLSVALEAEPDLVSVTIGANDARLPGWTADTFAQSFTQLLQPFSDRNTTIMTFAYPDVRPAIARNSREIPASWQVYFERMHATNDVIRQVSAQFNACLLDFESFLPAQNPTQMSSDMVHPNALGYKMLAEAALHILIERFDLPLPNFIS